MKSCLLCGVGGQGTVLASRILAQAAMNHGLFARTAETIGMSQRGGCVVSHVRIGDYVPSPMIPDGQADMMIGFEPGEVVRNLSYLKEDGIVITCKQVVQAVTASLSGSDYNAEDMIAYLQRKVKHCIVIDGAEICNICGSGKVLNVALVGAAAQSGAMGISVEDVKAVLAAKLKPQFLAMNEQALALGAQCVTQ